MECGGYFVVAILNFVAVTLVCKSEDDWMKFLPAGKIKLRGQNYCLRGSRHFSSVKFVKPFCARAVNSFSFSYNWPFQTRSLFWRLDPYLGGLEPS